jgi:hypothetical protein
MTLVGIDLIMVVSLSLTDNRSSAWTEDCHSVMIMYCSDNTVKDKAVSERVMLSRIEGEYHGSRCAAIRKEELG